MGAHDMNEAHILNVRALFKYETDRGGQILHRLLVTIPPSWALKSKTSPTACVPRAFSTAIRPASSPKWGIASVACTLSMGVVQHGPTPRLCPHRNPRL
jgi:hypothetical protein